MKSMAPRISVATALLALFLAPHMPRSAADTYVEASPAAKLAQGLNPANWQMPKWKMPDFRSIMPGTDEKARIKKKRDGFFGEVGKTASNSWSKTKAALSPDNFSPMKMFPASARTPSNTESEPKRGFFQSLFSPWPEEPQSSPTPSQFIAQPRP